MTASSVLKISVLSTGALLLDDAPATLADVEQAMEEGAKAGAVVWYYREHAAGEPPAVAMDVMKLIVRHRLPVRLCAKADFSDTESQSPADEQTFAALREKAHGQTIVVRPDSRVFGIPAVPRNSVLPEMLGTVERMLPSKVPRNVAVIADTAWAAEAAPTLEAANHAIPFFGLLMGFSTIGHVVWVFDGNPGMLSAGCRDADVLIVDSERLSSLVTNWQEVALQVMRNRQILVHDHATYQFRKP